MRRFVKYFAIVLLVVAITLAYLLNAQDDIGKIAHLFEDANSEPPEGAVTVQFLGNTNLLFSDGETSILFDGWFTRPGSLEALFGELASDEAAIDAALERAGVNKLAAVIPVYSHFDHDMDSPLVATRTGADLIGSESTLNTARGLNFDESRFKLVGDMAEFSYGALKITMIKSRHFVFSSGLLPKRDMEVETIESPLVPRRPRTRLRAEISDRLQGHASGHDRR